MRRSHATQSLYLRAALRYAEQGIPVFPLQPCGKTPLTPHGFKDATTDRNQIIRWWTDHPDANIGIPTGEASGIVVVDIDRDHGGEESWAELRSECKIPKTAKQQTGRGRHIAFRSQDALRCQVLAKGVDFKGNGGYIVADPSVHPNGKRYRWNGGRNALLNLADIPDWLLHEIGSTRTDRHALVTTNPEKWPEGERNTRLTSQAGAMRRRGMSREAIEAALLIENQEKCKHPLDDDEIREIADSVSRYEPNREYSTPRQRNKPAPLSEEAFHGHAGEIVRLIEPHSEADPAALLIQLLSGVGNMVGRTVHFVAEADQHHTNLFTVLVGRTAKGRKGTAFGQIQRVLAGIDPDWSAHRVMSGLSTGEGLIAAVRDNAEGADKRLLVMEPEFARVLQVCERQTNTLSEVIRQAWDSGSLRIITKTDPACATDAHISIIAHITGDELRRRLTPTAVANGFANRFLWFWVERSKVLPDGGKLADVDFEPVLTMLRGAIRVAKKLREIERTRKAGELWRDVYPELSEGKPGLLGSVTSRAEAQVMRLACIYALLDRSPLINTDHLRAALEVWRYAEDSARYIFGDAVGDPTADKILAALRRKSEGLTRAEIRELFHHDKSSDEIERGLGLLQDHHLAYMMKERTGGKGRPTERWLAVSFARKTP